MLTKNVRPTDLGSSTPVVLSESFSRFERERRFYGQSYNDGGSYSDSYSDSNYGDYSDASEDPDPTEN